MRKLFVSLLACGCALASQSTRLRNALHTVAPPSNPSPAAEDRSSPARQPYVDPRVPSAPNFTISPRPRVVDFSVRWELPEFVGRVCAFMDKRSPGIYYEMPRTFTRYIVESFSDLIAKCRSIATGACSGGIVLDGHSSHIRDYLSCTYANSVTVGNQRTRIADADENENLQLLKGCLARIGATHMPLTVTACSSWAFSAEQTSDECRQTLAPVLERPIVSVSTECSYVSEERFASADKKWKVFTTKGTTYELPGQTKRIHTKFPD